MNFDSIWARIVRNQGQTFATKSGLPFTYRLTAGSLIPDRTGYPIPISHFRRAAELGRLRGPGQISRTLRGSAYIYGILTDPRITDAA